MFLTSFKTVTGNRIDPKLYDTKTTSLKKSIRDVDSKRFQIKSLKSFLLQSIAGDWGIDDSEQEVKNYKRCLVIRATEFDNNYNLNLDNSRVKYRLIKTDKLNKIDIQENDLLIEKSGGSPDQPVGRIAIITNSILKTNTICHSNFIHKIRVDYKQLLPEYLFCYLKTIHNIKLTESMQSQTNGIRNLVMSTYLNQDVIIPILSNGQPDLKRQKDISQKIKDMRQKANELQKEATNILAVARQQVEQIICNRQYLI